MKMLRLETPALVLIGRSRAQTVAAIAALSPEVQAQVSADYRRKLEESAECDPWIHGFTVALLADDDPIGQCGFKGPPDAQGMVEIAYAIVPLHQNKGYATQAARALTEFALADAKVRLVRAHTLPEKNASTRVLGKCGFTLVGKVHDPEDGEVFRFELQAPGRQRD